MTMGPPVPSTLRCPIRCHGTTTPGCPIVDYGTTSPGCPIVDYGAAAAVCRAVAQQPRSSVPPRRLPGAAMGAVPAPRRPPAAQLHVQPALGIAHRRHRPARAPRLPCLPGRRQQRYGDGGTGGGFGGRGGSPPLTLRPHRQPTAPGWSCRPWPRSASGCSPGTARRCSWRDPSICPSHSAPSPGPWRPPACLRGGLTPKAVSGGMAGWEMRGAEVAVGNRTGVGAAGGGCGWWVGGGGCDGW